MTETPPVRRRTGGRSARVRSAVHQAVNDLLAEDGAERLTVAGVASRAGVNPTSIYRRWGTPEALVLDVEAARLQVNSPVPDTGTLRGDLLAYAASAARDITRPGGLAFLRAVMAAGDAGALRPRSSGADEAPGPRTSAPMRARGAQIQAMLDRARDRGEPALHSTDVLDGILAPIYLRTLFGIDGLDQARLAALVSRTLAPLADTALDEPGRITVPQRTARSGKPARP
jgi:AcrR family transcriptional regulator